MKRYLYLIVLISAITGCLLDSLCLFHRNEPQIYLINHTGWALLELGIVILMIIFFFQEKRDKKFSKQKAFKPV